MKKIKDIKSVIVKKIDKMYYKNHLTRSEKMNKILSKVTGKKLSGKELSRIKKVKESKDSILKFADQAIKTVMNNKQLIITVCLTVAEIVILRKVK